VSFDDGRGWGATGVRGGREAPGARGSLSWSPAADGSYRPTAKALDLLPLLVEMIVWSATYDADTAAPAAFTERAREDREALVAELRAAHSPAEDPMR